MTPIEARSALIALRKSIGPDADAYAGLEAFGHDKCALSLTVYANGITNGLTLSVYADDWAELFEKATAEWSARSAEFRQKAIRKIALEIIRITADHGACSDAALRANGISQKDITEYGPEACADANAIAANGPFAITPIRQANAA